MTPPLRISDIAQPDTTTQFISDVQLSTFHDHNDLNRDLMQRFMFTRGTGGHSDRKGTADLLKVLHQRVTPIGAKEDNRFVFMATYGHGKSHFGLALANYFGAPVNSAALSAVQEKLDHALPADQAQVFREYRADKAPFMVLILRGDRPGSLRDAFFQALDQSLVQNNQTKDLKPPFWFDKADDILERLGSNPKDTDTVNKYLSAHNLDLYGLRQLIKERRSEAFNLAVGAITEVHHVPPNLGGQTALNDAVRWIVTELCGPGKPFGGLLILFDEFSRFVQDYTQNNPIGAPLQELLSGVGDHSAKGKALFVGLSQHDPNVIAERYGGGEELIKELNRIPEANRHRMQTMLEDVLGGVLKTNDSVWQSFLKEPRVGVTVSDAADTALALFADRYGPKQLNWNLTTIMEKVAKQCFPLHPLTTAFLASVTLHSSGTVRSVLGFIQDEDGYVMPRFKEAALTENGQPNWVLPTSLVDYFGEALNEDKYKSFKNVIKPDLTAEQQDVLKAMLLLDVAELPTKNAGGYAAVIANLAGLEEAEAKRTLVTLEEQHYIRYDSANKTYSFWVGSNDALDLDRLLNEEIQAREQNKKIGQLFENFTGGTNPVNRLPITEKYPVGVTWGHPDDWAAQEVIVPVSGLNQGLLTALRTKYAVEIDRAPDARGVVVLVVPRTQSEANEAAEKIKQLLSFSDKDKDAPMLFLVPQEPHADLHTNLLKLALLSDLLFKQQAQQKVGPSAINEMWQNLGNKAIKNLSVLRQNSVIVVPPNITSAWNARAKPNLANRIGEALKVVYELAYPNHPDGFFTQYKQSSSNLSKATVDVIYELLDNSLDQVKWSANAKVPSEVVKLLQKDWKIVSPQQQIMEPEFTKVKVAWDRFEGTFSPKIKSAYADAVLLELMQPPYGYDQNTLALLFAAWIGRNRDAIAISGVGKLSRPAPGSKEAFKNPGVFLKAMSAVQIHRKDMAGEKAKVAGVLAQLRDGVFTEAEAKRGILTIQEFRQNNPRFDADYLDQLEVAAGKLHKGMENQAAYDKAVENFEVKLSQARGVAQVKPLADSLKSGFPSLSVVATNKPTIEQLQGQLLNHVTNLTTAEIKQYTQLRDIGQYSLHVAQLKGLSDALYRLGLPELKAQADAGLQTLARAKEALEASQVEAAEVSVVNSISVTGGLAALRESLEALRKLNPKSNKAYELSEKKYGQIKDAIAHLEGQLPNWQKALETVLDAKAAGQLSKDLLSQGSKYEGTPEAERMTALQGQAEALNRFFNVLSSTTPLRDPADVDSRRSTLTALTDEYAATLTEAQRGKVEEALGELEQQRLAKETEASQWLKKHQERFSSGNTNGLEKDLDSPPRFLSDTDRAALSELRTSLRSEQDRRAQEDQQLKLVRSLPHVGPMAALENSMAELGKITPVTEKVRTEADQKREKVNAEITRLNALLERWTAALASAMQPQALDELSKDITRNESYLRGTAHEENVQNLAAQVAEVHSVLRRAGELRGNSSTRLRDLAERRSAQESLREHADLSPQQREMLDNDIVQTGRIFDEQLSTLDKTLAGFQSKLDAVQAMAELDKINLSKFPHAGLPEDRLTQLRALEARRDTLRPLLNDLAMLGKQIWRTMAEAQELLRQYTALLGAEAWSEAQRDAVTAKRTALTDQLRAKRQEASAWLTEREEKLPGLDAKGLTKLEDELRQPHAFLDVSEHDRISNLKAKLHARLEEDQALQIEALFERIESPQRRAALLERLRSLLLTEVS